MKLRLLAMLALGAVAASAATDAEERLGNAAEALKEVMGIPDRSIPQELLAKAECVVIVPNLKKGAFIIGGQYGKGFATCRNPNGVGWSAPGAVPETRAKRSASARCTPPPARSLAQAAQLTPSSPRPEPRGIRVQTYPPCIAPRRSAWRTASARRRR